jgi:hypothetical protein
VTTRRAASQCTRASSGRWTGCCARAFERGQQAVVGKGRRAAQRVTRARGAWVKAGADDLAMVMTLQVRSPTDTGSPALL